MNLSLLTSISIIALGCVSTAALLSLFMSFRRTFRVLELLGPSLDGVSLSGNTRRANLEDASGKEFEQLKEATRRRLGAPARAVWQDRCFQAGYFSEEERRRFVVAKRITVVAAPIVACAVGSMFGQIYAITGAIFGIALGLQLPKSYLQRVIDRRGEEIMYYLPLVIEQLVIGVSSSLDVGPCIKWVIAMADERDSHNPVTELLRHAQQFIKSGGSMEEALIEIGRLSGHTELKHVFMALSQVAKHGGEITKQLQELANAVSAQREARIEGKIKRLELEATGPVGLVFLAFMGTLLTGLGTQLLTNLH